MFNVEVLDQAIVVRRDKAEQLAKLLNCCGSDSVNSEVVEGVER